MLLSASSLAWLTRLPVDGRYLVDLFPAFVVGGAGMGLSVVPLTLASLAGVERSDAGVASGLVNTSRQIGGAIGLAAASTIAATSASGYADAHAGVSATSPVALDHGFQSALVVAHRPARGCRGARRRLRPPRARAVAAGGALRGRRPPAAGSRLATLDRSTFIDMISYR